MKALGGITILLFYPEKDNEERSFTTMIYFCDDFRYTQEILLPKQTLSQQKRARGSQFEVPAQWETRSTLPCYRLARGWAVPAWEWAVILTLLLALRSDFSKGDSAC